MHRERQTHLLVVARGEALKVATSGNTHGRQPHLYNGVLRYAHGDVQKLQARALGVERRAHTACTAVWCLNSSVAEYAYMVNLTNIPNNSEISASMGTCMNITFCLHRIHVVKRDTDCMLRAWERRTRTTTEQYKRDWVRGLHRTSKRRGNMPTCRIRIDRASHIARYNTKAFCHVRASGHVTGHHHRTSIELFYVQGSQGRFTPVRHAETTCPET